MDERAEDDGFIEEDDAEFLEEDEILLENAVLCPTCNEMTGHLILNEKPKGSGADYLLQCEDCSKVHKVHIRPPPVVKIPFVLTEGPSSMTRVIEIDSDEVLYYVDGDFMSRNDIEIGQITLHPSGIPHGPHPGAYERSIGKKETHELAVMVDTFKPLKITKQALNIEVKNYYKSWIH